MLKQILILSFLASIALPAAAHDMLVVSDIHFNPMADPTVTKALAAAPADEWEGILAPALSGSLGSYGADTNWALLRSALGAMKAAIPNPELVILPGDFIAHDFRAQFNASAADHGDTAYRAFVAKTLSFLANNLRNTFPEAPIYATLGNNDDDCGDYESTPQDPFLRDSAGVIRLLARTGAVPFEQDWTEFGGYVAPHPTLPGVRLIFVDTVFFSTRYQPGCGAKADDPGKHVLNWLDRALSDAVQARTKVWLIYHIPPGVDAYSTEGAARKSASTCQASVKLMWQPRYQAAFTDLMAKYQPIIATSFAGHTHMDEFRLLRLASGADIDVLGMPGLSPIFGQNPAFRTVAFGDDGMIGDETTFFLANLPDARGDSGKWRLEYDFKQEWSVPDLGSISLRALDQRLLNDPAAAQRWRMLYRVSRAPKANATEQSKLSAAVCAVANAQTDDFRRCYCP